MSDQADEHLDEELHQLNTESVDGARAVQRHPGRGELKGTRHDHPTAPARDNDVDRWAAVANIGLVGVPLAYVTSKSILITLLAAAVATLVMIAYLHAHRRR